MSFAHDNLSLQPNAAAYVVITAIAGPVLSRVSDPTVAALQGWWGRRAQTRATRAPAAVPVSERAPR